MEDMTLRIECAGHTTVNIDELEELHHYGKITDEHYAHARNSLTELGFSFPFFYWEQDGRKYTVDGHSRLKVLKRMRDEGYTIPPLPADPIFAKDRAEAKKKILAQESRYKDFDEGLFTEFLAEDNLVMEDLENFVDIPGLDTELWEGKEDVIEDEAPAVNESEPAVSQLGQVYQLGRHRLMCGDATKIEDVEKLMDGQKADMVLTDPPYGINIVSENGGVGGGTEGKYRPVLGDDSTQTAIEAYNLCATLEIPKLIFFGGNYFANALPNSPCWLVWDKQDGKQVTFADCEIAWTNFKSPTRMFTHVWDGFRRDSDQGDTRVHPTQKPIKLMAEIMKDYGSENEKVLDLFGGSGSTLIACEQTNRTCYMMEIDPKYVDVIRRRFWKFTHDNNEEGWQEGTKAI